jgi:hypothetical protein
MNTNIDLTQINDADKLKSLAYDQIAAKEQAENNLRNINTRLSQVLGVGEQFKVAADAQAEPSASDEDLGIEDSADEADTVE